MSLLSAEDLLKPVPRVEKVVEIPGMGSVKLRQLSMSQWAKLGLWLHPDGDKPNQKRLGNYNLKKATECLVDADGGKLFDFPDTKAGNESFFEFAETVGEGGSGHWSTILAAVADLDEEQVDLLEK